MSSSKSSTRVKPMTMFAYGMGAFVNNMLAASIGGMLIILNLGLGMDPAVVGLIGALPRITDALTDPLMGYISDHTKSRWGRRRPYIFIGAIVSGLIYIALWWVPENQSHQFYFWWFLMGSILFYLAYTMFATPWVALGYELTPDYHERTKLMGVQSFVGQLAYVLSPWFLWFMSYKAWFDTQIIGARWLAILIGVVCMLLGIIPALALKERFIQQEIPKGQLKDFFQGLKITLSSRPFLLLGLATFLVFNGFILISAFQSYVIIYYIFGGDQSLGAEWIGYSGSLGAISTFIVIFISTWLGTRVGKRKAFCMVMGISIFGYVLKWFCYQPSYPLLLLLPVPFMSFGLGGLFPLMGAMMADVVDVDELATHQRREGMFASIFWWVVKLGMALALAGGGILLNLTGFNVALDGNQSEQTMMLMRLFDVFIPVVATAIAIFAVWVYPITEESANTVRLQLEQRRGQV